MTNYYQTSNSNYLVLPGNGGLLIASANIQSKNQDRIQATVDNAMARVKEALKNVKGFNF